MCDQVTRHDEGEETIVTITPLFRLAGDDTIGVSGFAIASGRLSAR